MREIKTDIHVHSLFTDHAYSTIEENARYAGEHGIELIAITDHYGPMFTSDVKSAMFHFNNMVVLPDEIHGVRVLRGVEIDIVDHKGNLAFASIEHPFKPGSTMTEEILKKCEFVIASVHQNPGFRPTTKKEHTEMYCNVLENPWIDMLGHSGRAGMPYDVDEVLKVAKEHDKIIEINNHSFDIGEVREVCKEIAIGCAERNIPIAVNSDAHFAYSIGQFDNAISLLDEIHFPEELIVNANRERLMKFLEKRRA